MRHSAQVPVEESVEEQWLRIGESSGTHVTLGGSPGPFHHDYDFVDFSVTIVGDGLRAKSLVRTMEDSSPLGLARFFQALSDDWRGERKTQPWEAVEHGLAVAVDRDSLGHVLLTFELRQSYRRDAWAVRAVVKVEPGEEMSQVAAGVPRLLAKP